MFKNVFFDLDGTLIDSLVGIRDSLNDALSQNGIKREFTYDECKEFIGRGTDIFLEKALKIIGKSELFPHIKPSYLKCYDYHQRKSTRPFAGMVEALKELKANGVRLYICTNKPHDLALNITEFTMPGLFDGVRGVCSGDPIKPDPFEIDYFLEKDHLERKESLFVGDSEPDSETADNAGLPLCLVKWGYGFYDGEWVKNAKYIINQPADLVKIVLEKEYDQ